MQQWTVAIPASGSRSRSALEKVCRRNHGPSLGHTPSLVVAFTWVLLIWLARYHATAEYSSERCGGEWRVVNLAVEEESLLVDSGDDDGCAAL